MFPSHTVIKGLHLLFFYELMDWLAPPGPSDAERYKQARFSLPEYLPQGLALHTAGCPPPNQKRATIIFLHLLVVV